MLTNRRSIFFFFFVEFISTETNHRNSTDFELLIIDRIVG